MRTPPSTLPYGRAQSRQGRSYLAGLFHAIGMQFAMGAASCMGAASVAIRASAGAASVRDGALPPSVAIGPGSIPILRSRRC
jgi:hypothetical protein